MSRGNSRNHRNGGGGISNVWKLLIVAVAAIAAVALVTAAMTRTESPSSYVPHPQLTMPVPGETAPVDTLAAGRADGNLSIFFIGDSLTDGWNATAQPLGYRPTIVAALASLGPVTATQTFKAGATLAQVVGRAPLPTSVDVAVIELGTNDVGTTDLPTFSAGYVALANSLKATGARLVCVGVWNASVTNGGFDDAIKTACLGAGGYFVKIGDIRALAANVAQVGTATYPKAADGAHPNDAGHAIIAKRVLASIEGHG